MEREREIVFPGWYFHDVFTAQFPTYKQNRHLQLSDHHFQLRTSSAVLRKSFLFISLLAMVAAQDAVVEEAAPAEAPAEAPAVAPVAPPAPPVAAAAPAKHEPSGWDGAATTSQ